MDATLALEGALPAEDLDALIQAIPACLLAGTAGAHGCPLQVFGPGAPNSIYELAAAPAANYGVPFEAITETLGGRKYEP